MLSIRSICFTQKQIRQLENVFLQFKVVRRRRSGGFAKLKRLGLNLVQIGQFRMLFFASR